MHRLLGLNISFCLYFSGYCKNVDVAILVYDASETTSFEKAKEWMKDFERKAEMNEIKIVYVLGNKSDLPEKVSGETGETFAADAKEDGDQRKKLEKTNTTFKFKSTSAKKGDNISAVFEEIAMEFKDRAIVQPEEIVEDKKCILL